MFKNNNGAFIRKIALNDLKINKLKFFFQVLL